MSSITDLSELLASMSPVTDGHEYVFATGCEVDPSICIMTFQEDEGTTYILTKEDAVKNSIPCDSTWARITLSVESALEAVGFTAVVATALADEGISSNPVAAYYHDHLFVPFDKADRALEILLKLVENQAVDNVKCAKREVSVEGDLDELAGELAA